MASNTLPPGSCSDAVKHTVLNAKARGVDSGRFGMHLLPVLQVVEVSMGKHPEEPEKSQARVVFEINVIEEMLNVAETVHGACTAWLVDLCTSIVTSAYLKETTGKDLLTVSQSLNIVYHSPATKNDLIRVVCTTLTVGARAMTARAEVWNATHHRLMSSGTHIMMLPSEPKSQAAL